MIPLHLLIAALFGWLEQEQRDVIEFLREENRVLKAQLQGHRLRLNDDERRRLAVIGQRLLIAVASPLSNALYGTTVWDPAVAGGTALLLAAVSVLAAALPARDAARIAPAEALQR